jgi:hypothetical protein
MSEENVERVREAFATLNRGDLTPGANPSTRGASLTCAT